VSPLDRGIVSEQNLEWLRQRGARYLVGTPKSQLRAHEAALLDEADWQVVQEGLKVMELSEKLQWAQHAHGAYLLRTNHEDNEPAQFWRWYIQLTQAEAAFRTAKSDLGLRPVFHQKTERVEAHILVCFLPLALWRSLEQWSQAKGLGSCARQFLLELDELRSMDVVLPTVEGPEVRLRVVARPEKYFAQLLAHLGLELPRAPKIVEQIANVMPKNGRSKT
jgi:hypothetical protein